MVDITQTEENMRSNIHIKVLIYGCFAILCHALGILSFYFFNRQSMLPVPITRLCGEMIEHTLMSAVILSTGALLMFYVSKNEDK